MTTAMIVSIFLGIGLSASAGFRVFIPLLVAAIAGKLGWIPLGQGFQWMAGYTAITCFATATIMEITAYYIPIVDNFLDTITTPMAIVAGTLLATSVLPVDNELLKWVTGILVGGGSAGIIQTGTSLLRLASTKTTAGMGNSIIATAEHTAALGTSVFAVFLPVIAGLLVLIFMIYLVRKLLGFNRH
jgi:Domain of unknown function (DUF4126)